MSNIWKTLKNSQVLNQGIVWESPAPRGKVSWGGGLYFNQEQTLGKAFTLSHPLSATSLHLRIQIQKYWEVGTLLCLFELQTEDLTSYLTGCWGWLTLRERQWGIVLAIRLYNGRFLQIWASFLASYFDKNLFKAYWQQTGNSSFCKYLNIGRKKFRWKL